MCAVGSGCTQLNQLNYWMWFWCQSPMLTLTEEGREKCLVSLEKKEHICNPIRKKNSPWKDSQEGVRWKCCLPPVCPDTKDPEKAKGGCGAFTHHTESKHRGGSPLVKKDGIQEHRHYLLGILLVSESKSLVHKFLLFRKEAFSDKRRWYQHFLLNVWKTITQKSCHACKKTWLRIAFGDNLIFSFITHKDNVV